MAPGLLGFAWADGDRMTWLPPQPPDNLDPAAASILEPEVPAGASESFIPVARESVPFRLPLGLALQGRLSINSRFLPDLIAR